MSQIRLQMNEIWSNYETGAEQCADGCSRKLLSVEKRGVASISFEESPNPPSLANAMAATDQERVFSVHLTNIDRILQSFPSPGVGH
ncbi:hypothetical protein LWI29_035638 [Acer saccharum]|uniref:Uncharacterized protein n=1 Tax=Acer saccharum TaxID=4024 RepID=A0AA39T8D5_ACESA|nr:hypothetical protein LWI29_035638 [Acer saccharum]